MRFPRLSAPVRSALAGAGAVCVLIVLQSLLVLFRHWHSREVWMWIDCADSPRVAAALDAGCDPNVIGAQGFPALCTASAVASIPATETLLRHGANPNLTTPDGNTPLMYVISSDGPPWLAQSEPRNAAVIQLLLQYHADVNRRNHKGETALMLASERGKSEDVRTLLAHGADVHSVARDGSTARSRALQNSHAEIADLLKMLE